MDLWWRNSNAPAGDKEFLSIGDDIWLTSCTLWLYATEEKIFLTLSNTLAPLFKVWIDFPSNSRFTGPEMKGGVMRITSFPSEEVTPFQGIRWWGIAETRGAWSPPSSLRENIKMPFGPWECALPVGFWSALSWSLMLHLQCNILPSLYPLLP